VFIGGFRDKRPHFGRGWWRGNLSLVLKQNKDGALAKNVQSCHCFTRLQIMTKQQI
jgi:hypothetical protein